MIVLPATSATSPDPSGSGRSPRRLAGGLFTFVALVYLFLFVVLLITAAAPRLVGWEQVVISSGSMAPTIPVGSVALLEPTEPDEFYDAPTVLTFRSLPAGDVVTHRVVDVEQDETGAVLYTTQGDANDTADARQVPHANVAGPVRAVVPHVGWPALWVQRGEHLALAAWIAATALSAAAIVVAMPGRRRRPPEPRRTARRRPSDAWSRRVWCGHPRIERPSGETSGKTSGPG